MIYVLSQVKNEKSPLIIGGTNILSQISSRKARQKQIRSNTNKEIGYSVYLCNNAENVIECRQLTVLSFVGATLYGCPFGRLRAGSG
jgi:hypothetical protein